MLEQVDVRRRHALKEVPANQLDAVAGWEIWVGSRPHLVRLLDDRRAVRGTIGRLQQGLENSCSANGKQVAVQSLRLVNGGRAARGAKSMSTRVRLQHTADQHKAPLTRATHAPRSRRSPVKQDALHARVPLEQRSKHATCAAANVCHGGAAVLAPVIPLRARFCVEQGGMLFTFT